MRAQELSRVFRLLAVQWLLKGSGAFGTGACEQQSRQESTARLMRAVPRKANRATLSRRNSDLDPLRFCSSNLLWVDLL